VRLQAERVMLAAETALGRSACRAATPSGAAPNFFVTKNRSASFPVSGDFLGTAQLLLVSPIRVGRPGNRALGLMSGNAKLYAALASSAVGDRRTFMAPASAASTVASSSVGLGASEPSPHESSQVSVGSGASSRPRSSFARYDFVPTLFTNAVAQDLWSEVHKGAVASAPAIRTAEFLAAAGLPRRLPLTVRFQPQRTHPWPL
jgi:hypothetical protein